MIEGQVSKATARFVAGWARRTGTAQPVTVQLFADVVLLATARADAARGSRHDGFRFEISPGLCGLLPRHTELTVVADGSVVLPVGDGVCMTAPCTGGDSLMPLLSKLESGYRISAKSGAIYLPLDRRADWTTVAFEAYARARDSVREHCGHDLVLGYGTLLGACREGNFISHDDDFDTWFFVNSQSAEAAAQAFHATVTKLEAAGLEINVIRAGQFHLRQPGLPNVDVFMGWFSGDEFFSYCAGGHRLTKSDVAAAPHTFLGREVLIPRSPERLLEVVYGPEWRTPDPHFQWRVSETVRNHASELERYYRMIVDRRPDE